MKTAAFIVLSLFLAGCVTAKEKPVAFTNPCAGISLADEARWVHCFAQPSKRRYAPTELQFKEWRT